MAGEHLLLHLDHRFHIHKNAGDHRTAEGIHQRVRHGVIDGQEVVELLGGAGCFCVAHTAAEGGGDGEASGVDVVFHVVVGTVSQHDLGLHIPDFRQEFAEQFGVVKDFQIVADTFVIVEAGKRTGINGFLTAHPYDSFVVILFRAEAAVCDIHVVDLPAQFLELEERTRHLEFNIVRMAGDRHCDFVGHGVALL